MNNLEAATRSNHSTMSDKMVRLDNKMGEMKSDIETVRKMQGPRGFNGSRVSIQQLLDFFF